MPQPSRADRAAVRKKGLEAQAKRSAKSFTENAYAEHDAAVASEAKAERAKAAQAAASKPKQRPGSFRSVPPSSQKKAGK